MFPSFIHYLLINSTMSDSISSRRQKSKVLIELAKSFCFQKLFSKIIRKTPKDDFLYTNFANNIYIML